MKPMSSQPYLSVVIPVYNEAEIIVFAAQAIINHLDGRGFPYEILLIENGSRDETWGLIQALERKFKTVRGLRVGSPGHGDYGLALKTGALAARGELIVNDEIDIGNFDFYNEAIGILAADSAVDMVIGSKTLVAGGDKRPMLRRLATWCVNALLRVLLGFKGTDTHGLKVWRRMKVESVIRACVTGKDMFASELVIRAERMNLVICEIPIKIEEKRKARVNIVKRIPHVFKNIYQMFVVFQIREGGLHREILRYVVVAVSCVLINLFVFNLLIFVTGVVRGFWIVILTLLSFSLATLNAFFLNKHWVFKDSRPSTITTRVRFIVITATMAVVGSVMTYVLTTFVVPPFGLTSHLWANVSLLLTIPVTFLGNFFGNKILVFGS
ncbi:MAG: bifunctional glycosyltransferase family 2/GtrA family protein [bacterium]|nr:bifunctional glycosyltransferase family 2/GtrA family protein [bacterium]